VGSLPPVVQGCTPAAREVTKNTVSTVPAMSSKKCYGKLEQRHRTLRQGSNALLCQHRFSGLMSNSWAQEQRSLTFYTLASRLQRPIKLKTRLHIWLHAIL
jgi:hypothetical protein